MSEKNVAAIRDIYDHWGKGDFTAGTGLFDPHVVLVLRPEFMDAGGYYGTPGIAGYMRAFFESWEKVTIEATEITPAGDSVMVAVRQRGIGTSSGVETDFRYFQAWTFRGGAVIRIESIIGREDALEAVGLPA